jgi:hypothetical protein
MYKSEFNKKYRNIVENPDVCGGGGGGGGGGGLKEFTELFVF